MCTVSDEDGYHADHQNNNSCGDRVFAVSAPADGVALLCSNGNADYVCGCADRCRAAADIRSESQRPCKNGNIQARSLRNAVDNGDHCCRKGNVVDNGACDGGEPQDDRYHQQQVAAAYHLDEACNKLENVRLLQTAYNDEQSDEEQQRLIIHLLQQLGDIAPESREGNNGDYAADESDCICVRNRRNGDVFFPVGMDGRKKLKNFFIDCKIPRDDRANMPIITVNGEIAAVGSKRIDRRFNFEKKGIKITFI